MYIWEFPWAPGFCAFTCGMTGKSCSGFKIALYASTSRHDARLRKHNYTHTLICLSKYCDLMFEQLQCYLVNQRHVFIGPITVNRSGVAAVCNPPANLFRFEINQAGLRDTPVYGPANRFLSHRGTTSQALSFPIPGKESPTTDGT